MFGRSVLAWSASLIVALTILAQPVFAQAAFDFNCHLGSGINLGNALDAPKEGDWGVVLQSEYFRKIRDAGFTHVRLPVRWSTHASNDPPYTIDPAFFARVEWAIRQARDNHLAIVIDMHHYEEFDQDPTSQSQRFLALWQQIAERLRNQPNDLAFEIYNEPTNGIGASNWNLLFAKALNIVRVSNPTRTVVVGPVGWNAIDKLSSLELPDDRNLLVTVHYYSPFHFTHQGASWVGPESKQWLGTRWTGSGEEAANMTADFGKAAEWGRTHNRPIYLGEFGAYSTADMDSRALWTKAVVTQAMRHGFSFAYWEFCSGFGAYDPERNEWRAPLLDALKVHALPK